MSAHDPMYGHPSPIRSDQAGWAALVSSSDEDTKPELSPSTLKYDTDSRPLLEPLRSRWPQWTDRDKMT